MADPNLTSNRLCSKCHLRPRQGKRTQCTECFTADACVYRLTHPSTYAVSKAKAKVRRQERATKASALREAAALLCIACQKNPRPSKKHARCTSCRVEYERAYALAHPDKAASAKVVVKARTKKNRQHLRAYHSEWRTRNPEEYRRKCAANERRWRRQNPERAKQNANRLRAKHRDKRNANTRDWRSRNRQRCYELSAIRRLRERHVLYERVDYAALRARDRDVCYICGLWVATKQMAFDHLIPVCKCGPHIAENLRVTHRVCNLRKGKRVVSFFEPIILARAI